MLKQKHKQSTDPLSLRLNNVISKVRKAVVTRRPRRTSNKKPEKSENIPEPFAWATNRRAHIHSLSTLQSYNIKMISGQVQCKKCNAKYDIELDLESTYSELSTFVEMNKYEMRHRAPRQWMNPAHLDCRVCGRTKCVSPVVAKKKREINWLFLLLGQTLGCCSIHQLKWFCKHTKNHRTGAKDRLLFSTYIALYKQLNPERDFNV